MKSKAKTALVIAGATLACVGGLALAFPKAADVIWHNATAFDLPMNTEPWAGGQELLRIPYAEDSSSQYLDLYLPEGEEKPPLFVLVHGGGFVFGDSQTRQTQWMYRYFRDHGYSCATVNYRLAQEAAYPAAVEDVKAAVRFLRANAESYGYDAERIAIWGESAGGYLAAMAAVTRDDEFDGVRYIGQGESPVSAKVSVLVDYYGVIDFGDMTQDYRAEGIPAWLPQIANSGMRVPEMEGYQRIEDFFIRRDTASLTQQELAQYNPRSYVPNLQPGDLKVIIVHGDIDITVPMLHSKRLEEAFASQLGGDSVFALYPHGCKHADDRLYTDEILKTVQAQMERFLSEKNQ